MKASIEILQYTWRTILLDGREETIEIISFCFFPQLQNFMVREKDFWEQNFIKISCKSDFNVII